MKIIQISSYFPPNLGGQQNVVRELSERLAKKGHHVEVFTSDIDCPKDKQLKSTKNLNINYLYAWEFSHAPLIPSLYKKLIKIPKDSIIHVHTGQAFVPEIVYRICKKRKIPYIAHIHGDPEPSSFLGKIILKPYKKVFLKRFLKNAQKIIVLTEDYKELISNKYHLDKNKIEIIPNGIGEEFSIKNKIKNKMFHLLFVGRISTEKNISKLIESVALCKSKFILNIVGEGELLDKTKELVKQKNLKNVIFHGRKIGKDLVKFYTNADIFLLVSRSEGQPLVLLEAMATSTPIIASNIIGIRNIIKNNYNGLLIKPTPEAIAEAIEKLIKNPKLRKKLSRNGLKEVKKYSWDKIIEQIEKVYKEVIKK